MKQHIPKVCEHCGGSFVCGFYGCWCSSIPVSDSQYEAIVQQYHDCLCPTCLDGIQSGHIRLGEHPSTAPHPQ